DYLAKNPARKVELPEMRKPCERFLTEAEIIKMLNALSGKNRLIFHCLVTLALRPGELFAVRMKDVQPGQIQIDEQTYRNRLKAPKTKSSVAPVVLPSKLETELLRWISTLKRRNPDDFVFESRHHHKPIDPRRYLRDVLRPKAKELGIEGFTYQAIRRTFATQAMEAGANLKHIQGQMRHAHAQMTDSYTKTIEQGQREAVERFDRKFFGDPLESNEKIN
ncbi:MAG TPA: site-specific integrase, partial [Terriglobia bacterium]|nr:site-specific integrase [Terriglobia bacterium]